ncbi:MAG: hypothetical protein J6W80_03490 [Kiritimatiellae bacterium]|nr:hypothetical protein [Kiritimatiellia bacterium]
MNTGEIDLGDRVRIRKATKRDLFAVERNLRDGDREEVEATRAWIDRDAEHADILSCGALAVFLGDDIIGYCGACIPANEGVLGRRRGLYFLSTANVWGCKKLFVKKSRAVLDVLLAGLPSWVDQVYAMPLATYTGAVRWLEKILGFKSVAQICFAGKEWTLMELKKKKGVDNG